MQLSILCLLTTSEPSYQLDRKSSLQATRVLSIQIPSNLAKMKSRDAYSLARLCRITILLSPRAILTLKAAGLNTSTKDRATKRYNRLEPELVCYQSALQPLPTHLAQRHLRTMHRITPFPSMLGGYRERSYRTKHHLLLRLARFHLEATGRIALPNVLDERYRERWNQRAHSGKHLQLRLYLEAMERFAQLAKMLERERWYRCTVKRLQLRLEKFYLEAMRRAHFPNMLGELYRECWVQCSRSGKHLLHLRPCLGRTLAKLSLVVSNSIGQLGRALGYVVRLESFNWCT